MRAPATSSWAFKRSRSFSNDLIRASNFSFAPEDALDDALEGAFAARDLRFAGRLDFVRLDLNGADINLYRDDLTSIACKIMQQLEAAS